MATYIHSGNWKQGKRERKQGKGRRDHKLAMVAISVTQHHQWKLTRPCVQLSMEANRVYDLHHFYQQQGILLSDGNCDRVTFALGHD